MGSTTIGIGENLPFCMLAIVIQKLSTKIRMLIAWHGSKSWANLPLIRLLISLPDSNRKIETRGEQPQVWNALNLGFGSSFSGFSLQISLICEAPLNAANGLLMVNKHWLQCDVVYWFWIVLKVKNITRLRLISLHIIFNLLNLIWLRLLVVFICLLLRFTLDIGQWLDFPQSDIMVLRAWCQILDFVIEFILWSSETEILQRIHMAS